MKKIYATFGAQSTSTFGDQGSNVRKLYSNTGATTHIPQEVREGNTCVCVNSIFLVILILVFFRGLYHGSMFAGLP